MGHGVYGALLGIPLVVGISLEVETTLGQVRGRAAPLPFEEDTVVFRGLPFARPPLKELRFAPPQPITEGWNDTRDATQFSPDCFVHNTGMSSSPRGISEDCLYLNIYVPSECSAGDDLPVIVYFYGGGFSMGSASFPAYNGASLIGDGHEKVVVATVNYRLGPLGFLASNHLRGLSEKGGMGNQGLLDQRLATQWVTANAKSFCGNPRDVSVWGESAGAASISNHLVMPGSKGLFHRAIIDSGPLATWVAALEDEAESQFDACAKSVGCHEKSGKKLVSCLQAVSAYDMIRCASHPETSKKEDQNPKKKMTRFTAWAPTVDGVELPEAPWTMAEKGLMHPDIPILLGSNVNEGSLLLGFAHIHAPHNMTAADLQALGKTMFPTFHKELDKMYPVSDYKSPWWALVQIITDCAMACPARRTARWAALANSTAYLYEFEHEVDVAKFDEWLGVFHGDDLLFAWMLRWWYLSWEDGKDVPLPAVALYTPDERALQATVSKWWMTFAKTGDPNYEGQSTLAWPKAVTNKATNQTPRMGITIEPAPVTHWRDSVCDVWDVHRDWR
jgi:carboxylesterase type B